ncbi:uncharacterized protein LOC134279696, partial [Saccostrea cucullata]|uniref:uncharacterized protein LOC134279696 n=1 Tax=Saccostrea cuccullata TaxID=36930 RepID=UPI002ED55373
AGQEKNKEANIAVDESYSEPFLVWSSVANTEDEFIGIWFGVIHHVVNEHEWILPYRAGGRSSCQHGPLTHGVVREIVRDKKLIKKIPYYLNCQSRAALENFQNLILKYSSKRYPHTPPVYRARNLVAALDHNANCERETARRKDGSLRFLFVSFMYFIS